MNWKSTSIIVISILCIGMYLGYLISYQSKENRNIYNKIIENEKKIIDSLFNDTTILRFVFLIISISVPLIFYLCLKMVLCLWNLID